MAMLRLHCCAGFFCCCNEGGRSSCSAPASHCSGFSGCKHWLWAWGPHQLRHMDSEVTAHQFWSTDSVVVVHQHSSSAAHGVLPRQGPNPCLLHFQADRLPLNLQGSPELLYFNKLSEWFWCTPRFENHCFRLSKSVWLFSPYLIWWSFSLCYKKQIFIKKKIYFT